jgi:threonine dehydratase
MTLPPLPTVEDVRAAAERLAGQAVRTPLLEVPGLSKRLGFRLLVKAECLQRTGSFKFRGAYNKLAGLDPETRRRGVVAFSSGNHAQGVAAAAELLGMKATIVMPADAPAIKLANTRGYGARVVTYDRWTESREEIAGRLAAEDSATLVPPFDDPAIIAGQGTVGLEIAEDLAARGLVADAVIAPASGGGLVAGIGLALAATRRAHRIYCAEPAGYDDHAKSLAARAIIANAPGAVSLCDALMAPKPGEITFALNRTGLAGSAVVSDAEVQAAMAVAFFEFKLVAEPGGAAALASALTGKLPGPLETVVAVISGGNVDAETFAAAIAGR